MIIADIWHNNTATQKEPPDTYISTVVVDHHGKFYEPYLKGSPTITTGIEHPTGGLIKTQYGTIDIATPACPGAKWPKLEFITL